MFSGLILAAGGPWRPDHRNGDRRVGQHVGSGVEFLVDLGLVNTVPGSLSVSEDTPLAIGLISVGDLDGNLNSGLR
ncbi:MAG: hypothetical protein U1F45_02100 [Burkholderiales bacterium]